MLRTLFYRAYTRSLRKAVLAGPRPRHVGLIVDGNRRWAREAGLPDVSLGHRYGARRVVTVLEWCRALGVEHVTVFLCSAENIERRDGGEIEHLMIVIENELVAALRLPSSPWRVHVAGTPSELPKSTSVCLAELVEATRSRGSGLTLTLAVGYGGRQEVASAARDLVREAARSGASAQEAADAITEVALSERLRASGSPDPDLIIRTSGEQRLSNFLIWQGAYSELYFCEAHWPAFRELDFLRALRNFGQRQRRYGA